MVEPESKQRSSADAAPDVKADSARIAFESVFDSVSTLVRETGTIYHQLIGLTYRSGRALDTHIELVKAPERVPVLIQRMRRKCDAVAHVHFARNLPENVPGLPHPERRTLVVIEIHDEASVTTTYCRVNRATREMTRGSLSKKDAAGASPVMPGH